MLRKFSTNHEDYIHDIGWDYYGKRLATCSSDQKLKVFDQDANGGIFINPHTFRLISDICEIYIVRRAW